MGIVNSIQNWEARSEFKVEISLELKSHTWRTVEVKTDLNSAVDAYFACMSGVTENLFGDSLALKVQLSTVISFVNTSIRNLKTKIFEESSLIFCGKKSTEKFDDSF